MLSHGPRVGRTWCPDRAFFSVLSIERLKATKDYNFRWLEQCSIISNCTLCGVKKFWSLLDCWFSCSKRSGDHKATLDYRAADKSRASRLCHWYTTSQFKDMQVPAKTVFHHTKPVHSNVQTTRLIGTTHFLLIAWHTFSNSLIKA